MGHDKTVKKAAASVLQAWREARGLFLSIELWMLVFAAGATVGGAWMALLGSTWSLAVLVLAIGYVPARAVLHAKHILSFPFL